MPRAMRIVLAVDDDISVRESRKSRSRVRKLPAGVCASAQEFPYRPRPLGPSCRCVLYVAKSREPTSCGRFRRDAHLFMGKENV
jgi:hypothetical protein